MSLTGLNDGEFTGINVMYGIGLGATADKGDDGQVIKSDGTNAEWGNVDGSELFTAGAGITITDNAHPTKDVISANVDGTTISKTGGTGSVQLNTLKVPNALTKGTNISYSSGTTYDGSSAITIDVAKVPNALTQGTNISYSAGTTYDGSSAITISSTDTNSTYTNGVGLDLTGGQPDEEFSTNNDALNNRGTSTISIGQTLTGVETQTIRVGRGGAHTIILDTTETTTIGGDKIELVLKPAGSFLLKLTNLPTTAPTGVGTSDCVYRSADPLLGDDYLRIT